MNRHISFILFIILYYPCKAEGCETTDEIHNFINNMLFILIITVLLITLNMFLTCSRVYTEFYTDEIV
jgi:hypothetical protein